MSSRLRSAAASFVVSSTMALGVSAGPAGAEGWHAAQPAPPEAASGESGVGVPVPLGKVGDIEFWAPNRGLLITAGNEAVRAGLYYYDGVSWRELSEVCGGTDGRIAWAGPDDFWTIADQQTGQRGLGLSEAHDRSLCHFQNGRVVASFAEPIGVAGSYQQMDAAACSGPSDCWFGGERLPAGANAGAFHLHWNGTSMTPVPSLEAPEPQVEDPARRVAGIAAFRGRFYESVQVTQSDPVSGGESSTQPFLLHRIQEGSSNPFAPLIPEGPLREEPEPPEPRGPFSFGEGAAAWQLSGFRFSGSSTGLWAVAGPNSPSSPARVTALLMGASSFQQISLTDTHQAFSPGTEVAGIAAEPGTQDAWVSLDAPETEEPPETALARVVRIGSDGSVGEEQSLPASGEALGHKGAAGPIACPAVNDCWLATGQGWLFHLGGDHPQDQDPYFQSLITFRPSDASLPFEPPDEAPQDDSGDEPASVPSPSAAALTPKPAPAGRPEPLFSNVRSKLTAHSTLALTFTLTTRSRVRLVALRHKRQVATTRRYTLAHGRHTLKLRLSPRAWPTKLNLEVKALGTVPLIPGAGSGTPVGGPTVVSTSERPLLPTSPLTPPLP
jgi:hypothetical protein